ncbi:MAG TPA: hypothetical protein VN630_06995 [Rhodanobacteraceae bacterium]|nr:hypothetical protein [Rhodanobacteraceae bacterium]
MNRVHVLLVMPWVASPLYTRLIAALAVSGALAVAVMIALAGWMHAYADWQHALIFVLGFAVWMLWSSYVATSLQLARDARDLRLPRIARGADHCLLLFAALSIGLPALACWALGVPVALATATCVLAAALGLAYMLLPFYVGFPLVMAVFIALTAHGLAASVASWWILIPALVVFDALRWWQLRVAASVRKDGLAAATVFYCYRRDAMRSGGWRSLSQTFLQSPMKAMALNLHGIGPGHPVNSLRLALGGFGMPKSFVARLQDVWRLLAFLLVFALFFIAMQLFGPGVHSGNAVVVRRYWISPLLIYGGVMASVVSVTAFASRTRSLWRKLDAELSLLALLPGLGKPDAAKRITVLASLAPATVFLAIVCCVLCAGAIEVDATAWAYVSVVLCCVGAFALIAASTLESLGGSPIHTAGYVLLYCAFTALASIVLSISLPANQYHGAHPELIGVVPAWLFVAWSAYLLVLAVLAVHGARELRKRSHAFLANAP